MWLLIWRQYEEICITRAQHSTPPPSAPAARSATRALRGEQVWTWESGDGT